ncbi:MAG TPA: sodium:glutamate symporter [Firmicutes bacterium]|jgi:ESS family glutamate:Na+ symporter|nr:sodium:glutamate symporter [Bacillota bacterium]
MNFSSSNAGLWSAIIQLGIIAATILGANVLRRKLPFVRKTLMPTSVLAGFVLLIVRNTKLLDIDAMFLEMITYHGIAIGFIAMSLRIPQKDTGHSTDSLTAPKSGALIISTYLIQGIMGLTITLALAYTVMPDMFKAAGILLPMAYGQGPGQANNVGGMYEALGFFGGRSFGLSIAASGFLCACTVGISYLNWQVRKGKIELHHYEEVAESLSVDKFQDKNEIPVSESIDRFSVQFALVLIVYLITYLVLHGLSALIDNVAPGLSSTLEPLLWGFNFIVGALMAILTRVVISSLRKTKMMTRQYQNNYLLSRISGLAFDVMIVAGIASIDITDLSGLWLPFVLLSVAGGVGTYYWLKWICKEIYPDYFYEGMISMYGMLTGTISSGVLLLREIDPDFDTPAANNLLTGSSFAIVMGAPMLLLIGLAPVSPLMTSVTLGLLVVYLVPLLLFLFKAKARK